MKGAKPNWLGRLHAKASLALAPARAIDRAEWRDWETWWPGHTDPSIIGDALLRVRVAEAVAWCEALAIPDDIRSEMLRPYLLHDGQDAVVCDLGRLRRQALDAKLSVLFQARVIAPGRFMLFFPDENLSDGYSQSLSDGFLDGDNAPPYDTWIGFFVEKRRDRSQQRYLLAYVPAAAVERVDAGIRGNAEDCIAWLDQSDVAIRRRIDKLVRTA